MKTIIYWKLLNKTKSLAIVLRTGSKWRNFQSRKLLIVYEDSKSPGIWTVASSHQLQAMEGPCRWMHSYWTLSFPTNSESRNTTAQAFSISFPFLAPHYVCLILDWCRLLLRGMGLFWLGCLPWDHTVSHNKQTQSMWAPDCQGRSRQEKWSWE